MAVVVQSVMGALVWLFLSFGDDFSHKHQVSHVCFQLPDGSLMMETLFQTGKCEGNSRRAACEACE